MPYNKETHWRIVVAGARIFGVIGILAGMAFMFSAFRYWTTPEAAKKVSMIGGDAPVETAVVAAFCFALGVLFLLVKADTPSILKNEQQE